MKDWLPLVGVVIAQVVILILFWLKQRSDDKRRWHEKRLDAYRALSRAGGEASQVFASAEEVEDLDDRRFVTAVNEADACILDVALLSTTDVRDKAEALRTLLEMCVVLDVTSEAFPRAGALLTARFEFESSVRQELGIEARRRFVVEADSKAELAWRAFRTVMVFGWGRLGGQLPTGWSHASCHPKTPKQTPMRPSNISLTREANRTRVNRRAVSFQHTAAELSRHVDVAVATGRHRRRG